MWQSSQRFLPNQPIDTQPTHQSGSHGERVKTSLHAKKIDSIVYRFNRPLTLLNTILWSLFFSDNQFISFIWRIINQLSFALLRVSSESALWDSVTASEKISPFLLFFFWECINTLGNKFSCYDNGITRLAALWPGQESERRIFFEWDHEREGWEMWKSESGIVSRRGKLGSPVERSKELCFGIWHYLFNNWVILMHLIADYASITNLVKLNQLQRLIQLDKT